MGQNEAYATALECVDPYVSRTFSLADPIFVPKQKRARCGHLRQEECEHAGKEGLSALELEEDGEEERSVQRSLAFE